MFSGSQDSPDSTGTCLLGTLLFFVPLRGGLETTTLTPHGFSNTEVKNQKKFPKLIRNRNVFGSFSKFSCEQEMLNFKFSLIVFFNKIFL